MSLKASISGVRGIVGETFTPDVIVNYTASYSRVIPVGKVLIGRDSRLSGEVIVTLVKAVLNMLGRDVVDIGIVPTPAVLYGVLDKGFSGGIIVTASHNPEEWNALKFVNKSGKYLSFSEFEKLSDIYEKKDFNFAGYNKICRNFSDDQIPALHLAKIIKYISSSLIKKRNFKVTVDAVCGGAGVHAKNFLRELNCRVFDINCEPTGRFPHPAEPKPENLKSLAVLTKNKKADVGFALDPDGDRLVIADNTGVVLSEESTLALCVKHYLKHYKKTNVVINNSTSRIIEDIAQSFGVKVFRTPTGEINVTEKMEKLGAKIGGEGNGGIIVPEINKCRDAYVGMAFILDMLAKEEKSIKELSDELPKYIMIKDKVVVKSFDASKEVVNKMKKAFGSNSIDTSDGIRLDFDDKWLLVRKSNTEPIVRIFAEAKTRDDASGLIEKAKNFFRF